MDDLDKLKDILRSSNTKNNQYSQEVEPGYFDKLEEKILLGSTQKNIEEEPKKNKKSLYIRLVKYSTVAAAVALLIFGINFYKKDTEVTYADNTTLQYNTDYLLETGDIYIEDFTEIEGIDEILDELEQQIND